MQVKLDFDHVPDRRITYRIHISSYHVSNKRIEFSRIEQKCRVIKYRIYISSYHVLNTRIELSRIGQTYRVITYRLHISSYHVSKIQRFLVLSVFPSVFFFFLILTQILKRLIVIQVKIRFSLKKKISNCVCTKNSFFFPYKFNKIYFSIINATE